MRLHGHELSRRAKATERDGGWMRTRSGQSRNAARVMFVRHCGCASPHQSINLRGGGRGNDSFTLFEVDHSQTKAGGEGARGAHPPMSRRAVCVRASAPEFSSRFRLCAPCCAVSTRSSTRRKRACGVVPRLGPEGFSLARICRGTGCTPRKHRHPRKLLVRTYEDKRDTKNISGF